MIGDRSKRVFANARILTIAWFTVTYTSILPPWTSTRSD